MGAQAGNVFTGIAPAADGFNVFGPILSLLNSTYLQLRKQPWQCSVRAVLCLFPGVAAKGGVSGSRGHRAL